MRDQASRLSATGKMALTNLAEDSPFYVPEDSEIFRMKEREKDRKKEERLANQNLKIWEKGHKAKDGLTMKDLKDLTKAIEQEDDSANPTKISLIEAAKSAIKNRVKNTEPMHEFIDKKREMLLFQMLIDHKREQINEFEELTRLHRKGLERAEQMLQEDMKSFNDHLNVNKQNARKMITEAEKMTRLKNDKVTIMKNKQELKAELSGKNTSTMETLESLKTYKDFLDGLNPELAKVDKSSKQPNKSERRKSVALTNFTINPELLDFLLEQDQKEQMYFKQPSQIINIFLNLEESNLFLMTNLKSTEQLAEVVRNNFTQKRKVLDAKKAELQAQKGELTKQINQVEKEIDQIRVSTNRDDFGELFNSLEADIVRMYKESGEKTLYDQKHISGFELLKEIQKRLENQVKTINEARLENPAKVLELERDCLNMKRDRKKQKNEEEMKELANLQKVQAQPKKEKRMGRPIMAKSKLKVEQKEEQVKDEGPKEEQIERRKYLT